jgi:hypothetical protein
MVVCAFDPSYVEGQRSALRLTSGKNTRLCLKNNLKAKRKRKKEGKKGGREGGREGGRKKIPLLY